MKKRKIFQTREERAAWRARGESIQRELQAHIDRITADLRRRGIEPPTLAEVLSRHAVERDARENSA